MSELHLPFRILYLLLLLPFITPSSSFIAEAGEAVSAESQALELQNKYNSLTSLTFSFTQITKTGTRERTGSGDALFYRYQKPMELGPKNSATLKQSVMRWNYTEPDPQIIVSDGYTLSIYTEKDKQLIKTSAKELESDITYAFFAGTRNLLDDFTAEIPERGFIFASDKKMKTLLLVPRKPHNQIKDVQVWYDEQRFIHYLRIEDHFESVTELSFENIQGDSLPPGDTKTLDAIVSFPIPPGTEIISH